MSNTKGNDTIMEEINLNGSSSDDENKIPLLPVSKSESHSTCMDHMRNFCQRIQYVSITAFCALTILLLCASLFVFSNDDISGFKIAALALLILIVFFQLFHSVWRNNKKMELFNDIFATIMLLGLYALLWIPTKTISFKSSNEFLAKFVFTFCAVVVSGTILKIMVTNPDIKTWLNEDKKAEQQFAFLALILFVLLFLPHVAIHPRGGLVNQRTEYMVFGGIYAFFYFIYGFIVTFEYIFDQDNQKIKTANKIVSIINLILLCVPLGLAIAKQYFNPIILGAYIVFAILFGLSHIDFSKSFPFGSKWIPVLSAVAMIALNLALIIWWIVLDTVDAQTSGFLLIIITILANLYVCQHQMEMILESYGSMVLFGEVDKNVGIKAAAASKEEEKKRNGEKKTYYYY